MVAFVVSVKHHVRGEYGLEYEGEFILYPFVSGPEGGRGLAGNHTGEEIVHEDEGGGS